MFSRSSAAGSLLQLLDGQLVLLLGFRRCPAIPTPGIFDSQRPPPSALPTETAGATDPQRGLSEKTREQVEMHPEKPQGRRVSFKKARGGGGGGQKGYGMQVAWQKMGTGKLSEFGD